MVCYLVKAYNNSYHRTIRQTPNDVFKKRVKSDQKNIVRYLPSNLKVGDTVRVKYTKQVLGKGDYIRYSQDTYVITKIKGNKYYLDNMDKPYKDLELRQANTIETYDKAQPIDIPKERSDKTTEKRVKKAQKELFTRDESNEVITTKRKRQPKRYSDYLEFSDNDLD